MTDSFYSSLAANHTAGWQPEPTFRGTFSILSSCLVTMVLCVWTAVHLNIPEPGDNGWFTHQTGRKVTWVLRGMFIPEGTAWVAYHQRKEACRLHSEMRKRLGQPESPSRWSSVSNVVRHKLEPTNLTRLIWKEKRSKYHRHEWTMVHSFYVLMGGFELDLSNWQFIKYKTHENATLTADGAVLLAEHFIDSIPDIPETHILDKSKASALAKLLVCGQTAWFCCQCIARLSQGLTISLLELNTFVHAICALLSYIFWWHKPLDISESTILQSNTAVVLLLVKAMQDIPADTDSRNVSLEPEFWIRDAATPNDQTRHFETPELLPGTISISRGQVLYGYSIEPRRMDCNVLYLKRDVFASLEAALKEARRCGIKFTDAIDNRRMLRYRSVEWFYEASDADLMILLVYAGLCYGGIHVTAWNAPFPTLTQQLLWRVSSISLLVSALLGFIIVLLIRMYNRPSFHKYHHKMRNCVYVTTRALGFIAALFYMFCRVFLVVECFLTLAHLPESVYQVPNLSRYFPHIG